MASSVAEKKAFVVCLYKMVHKYLVRKKPEFNHIDTERLQEMLVTAEAGGGAGRGVEEEVVQQGEWIHYWVYSYIHYYMYMYNIYSTLRVKYTICYMYIVCTDKYLVLLCKCYC